jgi:hypothetical protein
MARIGNGAHINIASMHMQSVVTPELRRFVVLTFSISMSFTIPNPISPKTIWLCLFGPAIIRCQVSSSMRQEMPQGPQTSPCDNTGSKITASCSQHGLSSNVSRNLKNAFKFVQFNFHKHFNLCAFEYQCQVAKSLKKRISWSCASSFPVLAPFYQYLSEESVSWARLALGKALYVCQM